MLLTIHAREKMKEYGIEEKEIEDTIKAPEKAFLDIKTGREIAVKSWKDKHLVVVFERNDIVNVVTVFPTSKINKVVERRLKSRRWLEI